MNLERISEINLQRCERWHPTGLADWTAEEWGNALFGEAGELANVLKKVHRHETSVSQASNVSMPELLQMAATEIGDTYLYLDLSAQRVGWSLHDIVSKYASTLSPGDSTAADGNRLGIVVGRLCEALAHPDQYGPNRAAPVFWRLVHIAEQLGLDLEICIVETFNRVSAREGFPERLATASEGQDHD